MLANSPHWLVTADAVPEAMTPVMRQVLDAKRQQPDALILFRLGDFYEMFFEDAIEASRLLDLTLTSRNKNDVRPIPMCGFPYHALPGHVQRAVEAGRRCAIVEQLTDPGAGKGIVQRGVTHVITPGVILETEALDTHRSNHLVALAAVKRGGLGLAVADASTGELQAARVLHPAALGVLLARLEPKELVLGPGALTWLEQQPQVRHVARSERPLGEFKPGQEVEAGLELLRTYLSEVRPQSPGWLGEPKRLDDLAHLQLPWQAVAHLELLHTSRSGRRQGSLLDAIDRTQTAAGARWLRALILAPLADRRAIELRHGAVAALVHDRPVQQHLRSLITRLCDVARVSTRCAAGLAHPRELGALRETLRTLPEVRAQLELLAPHSLALAQLAGELEGMAELLASLELRLAAVPPPTLAEGGAIAQGWDPELDEWLRLTEHSQQWLDQYEQDERQRTGLSSLKVGYNRVSGYGIEVSLKQGVSVPTGYLRKQTLKNVERFTTPDLTEFERKMLRAETECHSRETNLYRALLAEIASFGGRLRSIAAALADLDVHAGFAQVAAERSWVQPTLIDGPVLGLKACRHPVIEALLPPGQFVANDVALAGEGVDPAILASLVSDPAQLLLITGPNMAGKSTLMRQVALCTILCQAGSFVPAEQAVMGVLDAVLTRIGAGDDIAEGASTFLVEMREVADILARATPRTLVVLDEIGRGTSTWDGLAIAWSVLERMHDRSRSLCLCATHYHELTVLSNKLMRLRNVHVAVKEWGGEVVFIHQLQPGPTSRSHGVTVAKLAGLPEAVIDRARNLLDQFERNNKKNQAKTLTSASSRQQGLFDDLPPPPESAHREHSLVQIVSRIAALDPDTLSPRQAHEILAALIDEARMAAPH